MKAVKEFLHRLHRLYLLYVLHRLYVLHGRNRLLRRRRLFRHIGRVLLKQILRLQIFGGRLLHGRRRLHRLNRLLRGRRMRLKTVSFIFKRIVHTITSEHNYLPCISSLYYTSKTPQKQLKSAEGM